MTKSTQPTSSEPGLRESQPELRTPANPGGDIFAFPLSPAQEKMWHGDRAQPGNPSYNAAFRWALEGRLDPSILERTFNEIVCRHEILRATFTEEGGEPVQLSAPSMHVRLQVQDLRSLPPEQREAEMDRLSAEEARRGFDVTQGPLLRIGLLRMKDEVSILTLTIHHLLCDGWSIGLIMEELQQIYSAFAEGKPSPLSPLAIQYADYVVWQREQLTSEGIAQQLAYWKTKLAGYHRLEVEPDLPRPSERTTNSAIVTMMLPRGLTHTLKSFSNEQGSTLFIVTLAACLTLLKRYTGATDLAVGSPLAGRSRTDLEGLVGLFVNHVVFRASAEDDPLFTEFTARVRETVWEAFANQDVPFENVLKSVRPSGDPFAESFYLVNFICQREYARASTFVFEFAGIRMSTMPSKSQGALYDLNFFMVEREAGWRLSLEYNTDLYRQSTAEQMVAHFRELLDAIAANPVRRLSELPLSSGAQLPRSAPSESGDYSLTRSSKPPREDTPTVESGDEVYLMPASPAQQRFWLLAKLVPGNRAFYMPACVRVMGSLSVETLQKAFQLLVDRHETLRTTFEEKGELMQVIAARTQFALSFTPLENIADSDREKQLHELTRQEAGETFDLSRGPLVRARLFRLAPREHVLVVTVHHILADGWSQGIIQKELWSAYEALAESREPSLPPLNIQYSDFTEWQRQWLTSDHARDELSFWTKQLVPPLTVLDFPTDRPPQNRPASRGAIETLLVPEDLMRSLKSLSQSQEVTMFTLMLACFGLLLHRYTYQEDVLIGSPVANRNVETEGLIGPFAGPVCLRLNLSDNPTLRELIHRVRDVVLDALSHTELPFEVMVEKLTAPSVHGRSPLFQFYFFYQTAFLQPRQIKDLTVAPMPTFSLGTPFEIQLGFVERQEGVRAQLEYNSDLFDVSTIQGVLSYLETLLRQFVANTSQRILDLPTPPRAGHRADSQLVVEPRHEHVSPRDSTELQLLLTWEKLLGRHGIGVRDNFFELGGQSLLAAHLVIEVGKSFGRKIDLSTLLTSPTIEQLAKHLRGTESTAEHSSLVPIRPLGSKPPLFAVHGGGGHVLRFRAMAARLDADQPFYGLRSPEIDGALNMVTVEELAGGYLKDIRAVQSCGPYNLSGASFGGLVAYEMARQLVENGEQVGVLALFDTGNPAYYRDLSFTRMMRFRAAYLLERVTRYCTRMLDGEFRGSLLDLAHSAKNRLSYLVWGLVQRLSRLLNRPMPGALRDNVNMFSAVARAYTPRTYRGRMILFRAAGRTAEYGSDPALGWDEVVRGGIDILTVPGDHMTILEEPHVWDLVEQLNACLEKVRAERSAGKD